MKTVKNIMVTVICQGKQSNEEFEEGLARAINNGWNIKGITFGPQGLTALLVGKKPVK